MAKEKSILEKLGINPYEMKAQELQEKLEALKQRLIADYNKAKAEIENEKQKLYPEIRKEITDKVAEMHSIQMERDKIGEQIAILRAKSSDLYHKWDELSDEVTELNKELENKDDMRSLNEELEKLTEKFNSYQRILETQIKRVLNKAIQDELLANYSSSVKQLEDKDKKVE